MSVSVSFASAAVLLAYISSQETASYLLLPQAGGVPRLFHTAQTGSNYTVLDESFDEYHHFSLNVREGLGEIGLYNINLNNTVAISPFQRDSFQGYRLKDYETGLEVTLVQGAKGWQIEGPEPGELNLIEVAAYSLADA